MSKHRLVEDDEVRLPSGWAAVGVTATFIAAVLIVVALNDTVHDRFAPWMETRSAGERGLLGVAAALAVLAPVGGLSRVRGRVRHLLAYPVGLYAFTGWILLSVIWWDGRSSSPEGRIETALYRSQVDWFIVTSVLVLHGLPGLLFWLWRRNFSAELPVGGEVPRHAVPKKQKKVKRSHPRHRRR